MKKFSNVNHELHKINANNVKGLSPDRQVKAIRLWTDQNIKKAGPCGTQNTDEEMQVFITEAAAHLGIDVSNATFQREVKKQRGWGSEWKSKLFNKNGVAIDVDAQPLLSDKTLQGALAKIIQDNGNNHHGNTKLGGQNGECLHWRIGSVRIFGSFVPRAGLTLIGIGRHTGSGNSSYNVDLIVGGKTSAETA